MNKFNLNEMVKFSGEKPVKTDFLEAEAFRASVICLKKGVEITPHPEDYSVLFVVLEGSGVFTGGNGEATVGKNECIHMEKGETRGIKATADLAVLGIRK